MFIELPVPFGPPIYVNPHHVSAIRRDPMDESGALLTLTCGAEFRVTLPPEFLKSKLEGEK